MIKAIFILVSLFIVIYCQSIDDSRLQVASETTSGGEMVGSVVTVNYQDGTTEQGVWSRVNPNYGEAYSDNFFLIFDGSSTYPVNTGPITGYGLWLFGSQKPTVSFSVNLEPGYAIWDNISETSGQIYTPNSGDGYPFTIIYPDPENNTNPVDITNLSWVYTYSVAPTFPGRQRDAWYVLTVVFNPPIEGTLRFRADTDTLTQRFDCENLPTIEPLEVNYVPHLATDTIPPPLYQLNGEYYVHLELRSQSATNRRTGISFSDATWIHFGRTLPEPTGCVAGTDYNWNFTRTADSNGTCWDIYTLDISLIQLQSICGLSVNTNTTNGNNMEVMGIISIRTITDRVVNRSSGVEIHTASPEYSEEGFIINIQTQVRLTSPNPIRSYAPVEITGVIYEYYVPTGLDNKTVYIETTVQDPQFEGFRLVYDPANPLSHILNSEFVSDPTPESLRISQTWSEVTSGCNSTDFAGTNGVIKLCTQRWKLNIDVAHGDPIVCVLKDIFYNVPFTIVCNNPNPLLCPLTNATNRASIVVHVNTDPFCGQILASYQLNGSLYTYRGDFSALANGFFENERVGYEIILSDSTSSGVTNNIVSISVIYLAGLIGATSDTQLFAPQIYSALSTPGIIGGIITGSTNTTLAPNRFIETSYSSNVCLQYPRTGVSPTLGCEPNVLRFTFNLASSVWPIPLDDFRTIRVGVLVNVQFSNLKREMRLVLDATNDAVPTTSTFQVYPQEGGVKPSKPSDSAVTDSGSAVVSTISVFVVVFVSFLTGLFM